MLFRSRAGREPSTYRSRNRCRYRTDKEHTQDRYRTSAGHAQDRYRTGTGHVELSGRGPGTARERGKERVRQIRGKEQGRQTGR